MRLLREDGGVSQAGEAGGTGRGKEAVDLKKSLPPFASVPALFPTLPYLHTHTHTHAHTHTHTQTHTHTHIRTHTRTHAHTENL